MKGSWQCPNCRTLYFSKKRGFFRKSKKICVYVLPGGSSCCNKCYFDGDTIDGPYVADGSIEAYVTSDGELKLREFRPEITQKDEVKNG